MQYHLYQSECVADRFQFFDLAIVRVALKQNSLYGITGFLYRNDTHFFQYIEGPPENVSQLVANIKADYRHRGFQTLASGLLTHRRFTDWSMGYSNALAGEGYERGASVGDEADWIIDFLMDQAERQRQQLNRVAASPVMMQSQNA